MFSCNNEFEFSNKKKIKCLRLSVFCKQLYLSIFRLSETFKWKEKWDVNHLVSPNKHRQFDTKCRNVFLPQSVVPLFFLISCWP